MTGTYTILSADESAALMARDLRMQLNFTFLRYGDGAIECINGLGAGRTKDDERYSPQLGAALLNAWDTFMSVSAACQTPMYVGDWLSAGFTPDDQHTRYEKEYAALLGPWSHQEMMHFEALLLHRSSPHLREFYTAAKEDERRKIFLGPADNHGAARLLGATHIVTPMTNLLASVGYLADTVRATPFDVLYWGCGMAGSVLVARLYNEFPHRTYINLGSAMDPLFRGRSRNQQLSRGECRELLKGLL